MLRVTKERKRKYVSLGISVNPKFWYFSQNQPKPDCPNREYIELLIADKLKAYNSKLIELKVTNQEFTSSSLVDKVEDKKDTIHKTVNQVFLEYMERLENEKRQRYMLSVKYVHNSLLNCFKHLNILFSEIDVTWLRKYETWLRKKEVSDNTLGIHFRTLRVLYNIAIEENIVKANLYPFKTFKVSKLYEETTKRALSKENVDRIISFKRTNKHMELAIDIFAFTFYTGGINLTDIANLKRINIINNILIYNRQKTGNYLKFHFKKRLYN